MGQRYRLTVPNGVAPGQVFLVNVGGQQMQVRCPPNTTPGMQIEITAPGAPAPSQQMGRPQVQPQVQQQQYHQQGVPPPQQQYQQQGSPPPQPPRQQAPPPPAMAPNIEGKALPPQCQKSMNAERQLAQFNGPPPADLIFEAMDRDGGGNIDVGELQYGLSQGGNNFSETTCQLLINMYDKDRNGSVSLNEFRSLWGYIDQWRNIFEQHDRDRSGCISRNELEQAFSQIGYVGFRPDFFDMLMRTYDKENKNRITFDQFIRLFSEIHNLTECFKINDTKRNGEATFKYEEFLKAAYSVHP